MTAKEYEKISLYLNDFKDICRDVIVIEQDRIADDPNPDSYHLLLKSENLDYLNQAIQFLFLLADPDTAVATYEDAVALASTIIPKKRIRTKRQIIKTFLEQESIKPKTDGQIEYVSSIENNLITFAVGPAGTGKSFLAIAMACRLLKDKVVHRIVLSRPVVEAGENLGFLPGDLKDKIDPYMRPLYDSLYDILGKTKTDKLIDDGIIEIAPLAYMRGRTISDSFVLLDEAQNATHEQLKMFLTRFGENSKMVINCDPTQIDLPGKRSSCISDINYFNNVDNDIKICQLTDSDVTRHPIVGKIIKIYRAHES